MFKRRSRTRRQIESNSRLTIRQPQIGGFETFSAVKTKEQSRKNTDQLYLPTVIYNITWSYGKELQIKLPAKQLSWYKVN